MRNTFVLALALFCIALLSPEVAFSQGAQYNIKTMTPAIKMSLESRRDRYDQLQGLKKSGVIGENNQGYIEVLQAGKGAESIAERENKDRRVIYDAIVEQNNLENSLNIVEKVFAQVQRDKALSGEKIQDENGNWITKE